MEVTNRFKGLDLIDRVPEELWQRFVTCTGGSDQDHPQEKEMQKKQNEKKKKKAKWLSEEALQIAVKTREVKSKGEKERYTHLNGEF